MKAYIEVKILWNIALEQISNLKYENEIDEKDKQILAY